jgi:hypothetical protein
VAAVTLGMAGICFQNRVGDPAFGWEADHLEPGVSIRNRDDGAEHALHYLACMGNDAVVTSGACRGARGTVTGEHAHVLVDFPPELIELLAIGDRIQVKAIRHGGSRCSTTRTSSFTSAAAAPRRAPARVAPLPTGGSRFRSSPRSRAT